MRPLRLRMTGFGPFPETVELDFQSVTDHPLFGIYGPTGGGKTTILDAISFALFGESSGAERQAEGLRSHFVGPEVESVVELLFETGGVRYFVRRSPKQELAKQRGEGTRERSSEAFLFDATALEPGEVSFPDHCGRSLAERKVGEVNTLLEEIVGFRAEQFRQVVLLPQGKFRELLTASSHQRSDILKRLFETRLYESLSATLKGRAGELGREKSLLEERLRTILSSAGVESQEELAEGEAVLARELTALQEERNRCETKLRKARSKLEKEQERQRRFRERSEAQEALKALDARAEEMEALRERLELADSAAEGELSFEQLREARKTLEERSRGLEERRRALAAVTKRKESAEALLRELAAGEAEREARKARIAEYDRLREEVGRLRQEREILEEARSEREKLETQYREAEQGAQQSAGEVERHTAAIEELQGVRDKLNEVIRTAEELSRRSSLLSQLRESEQTMAAQAERLRELDRLQEEIARRLRGAREEMEGKERLRWERYRYALAEELAEGAPCPVCGSTEHPAPAQRPLQEETIPGEEEITKLRQGVEGLLSEEGEVQREKASLEAERRAVEKRLDELKEELGVDPATDEREESHIRLGELQREKEELEERLGRERSLRELRESERKRAEEYRRKRDELSPVLQEARSREGRAETRAEELESRLPEDLRRPEVLQSRRDEETRRLEAELKRLRGGEAEAKEASNLWSAERARLEECERQLRESEERVEERLEAFRKRLTELGFQSEEAFEEARLGSEERKSWRQRLEEYGSSRAAALERLRRAEEATDKEPEPRVAEAAEEVETAEGELNTLTETISSRRSRLEQLERSAADYRATSDSYSEVEEQHRLTSQLSDVAEGKNELRTRLVDYVLSVYFEEVLAQANQRLFSMSNRRYTLHRRGVSGSGRGHAGLDIDVYDAHTDRLRDASTLSGGEGFLASLALALGLSDTVQAELGGLHLEVIFIDEGFGHLDEEALEEALNTLDSLTGSGRSVGIISHVEEVKRRVPAGFEVYRSLKGSRVESRRGGST